MFNRYRKYQLHGWVHTCLTSGKFSTTPGTFNAAAFQQDLHLEFT